MAKNKFDVVSIQFALHYFFETKQSFLNVAENISNNLKNGGFFVGTCFNGRLVDAMLRDLEVGQEKQGYKDGKLIWAIRKNYKVFDKKKPFGNEIEVYVESINKYHKEYLVDYDVLKLQLEKYNLYPLTAKEEREFGFTESMSNFSMLFDRMITENELNKTHDRSKINKDVLKAYEMTNENSIDERQFSFLNMCFVFRKAAKTKAVKK